MRLEHVDLNDYGNRTAIVAFYNANYEAPDYLKPQDPNKLQDHYYFVLDGDEIVAVTRHKYITPHLVETSGTVVRKDRRGQGIGKFLNEEVEDLVKRQGFNKIKCNIYTDNLPSLFLKLKKGYIIEGFLRDHDEVGKDEYVLGKFI